MRWVTAFDLDQVGFKDWYVSAFGLIFVAIGLFHLSFATTRRLMAGRWSWQAS